MAQLFQSLLLLIATASKNELARQIKYLKVENEILRSKLPARITVTTKERSRLVRFAKKLGTAIYGLATIVTPQTVMRWLKEDREGKNQTPVKRGRRRTSQEICLLVVKLARENNWGYTRILGEIRKLGIKSISRNTVKRILAEHGFDPGPTRGEGSWDEFLKRHAASLWQCDFFSQKTVTFQGIREAFVLAFLNVKTRQVILSPATHHPNEAWVLAQTNSFMEQAKELKIPIGLVQHDRDTKFTRKFDELLKQQKVKPIRNAFRAPNTNAYIERFVQSIGQECLDQFVIFGTGHLDHLCQEYLEHYHHERPHQALDNEPLIRPKPRGRPKDKNESKAVVRLKDIRCKERLGGLLKSYSRRAA
ncbi:MAG: integrase core domain-containing protein [Planctomycetaceae bacterium]